MSHLMITIKSKNGNTISSWIRRALSREFHFIDLVICNSFHNGYDGMDDMILDEGCGVIELYFRHREKVNI